MLLAIDARERRVVGVMVAKGIGGDDPLPLLEVRSLVIVINAQRILYSGQCDQESVHRSEGGSHDKTERSSAQEG
jgi:hypothetical protein